MSTTGSTRNSIPDPVSAPLTGRPVNWFHRLEVARSYISLLERYSSPDEPNVNGASRPGTRPANRMPAPHSVQYARLTGVPPTVSLTISCQSAMRSG